MNRNYQIKIREKKKVLRNDQTFKDLGGNSQRFNIYVIECERKYTLKSND